MEVMYIRAIGKYNTDSRCETSPLNNSGMAQMSTTKCVKEEENERQGFEVKERKGRGHRGQ